MYVVFPLSCRDTRTNILQACKQQKDCRDAAEDLIEDIDAFLEIRQYIPKLENRKEAVYTVKRMLLVITDIAKFIYQEHPRKFYR